MNSTLWNFVFPVALGALFGLFRYTFYRKADPANAATRAAKDGALGAIGMTIITVLINSF